MTCSVSLAQKASRPWIVLAGFLLAAALASCASRGEWSHRVPVFGIHYYPYSVSGVRATATPTPNYSDWNDARMRRDLDRLGKLGIDVVIVSVNPEEITKQGRGPAYLRFVELAGKIPQSPKIMFMAECHGAKKADVEGFMDWCAGQRLHDRKGYFQFDGKPLVELYDPPADFSAIPGDLTVRQTVWRQKWHSFVSVPRDVLRRQWYWSVAKTAQDTLLSHNREQAMVFAGFLKDGDKGPSAGWDVDRSGGKELRERFRAALALNPKMICVVSWNDFWEGHFIEPNSLDGSTLGDVLKEEIAAAKAHHTKKGSP